jgi:UDP-N-acetylmuramate--alanine ligase
LRVFRKIHHIHFVGIGGAGMSGIAEILLNLGYRVSGSDLSPSEQTKRLSGLGGKIFVGHRAEQVEGAEVLVYSSAILADNVEVVAARQRGVPVIPRAEMLAELMRLKYGIAVAGAHGKTTTTTMIATVLAKGGFDPTAVIGGKVNSLGSHAKKGEGEFLVAEADESDGSFLKLSPTIAVVTTLDREHLDHYGDFPAVCAAFQSFVNKIPFYGLAVLCADEEPIRQRLIPNMEKRYATYGLIGGADYMAFGVESEGFRSAFSVLHKGEDLGRFTLPIPGLHNVANALAALAVGIELEVPVETIQSALADYPGVERRFHLRGEKRGILVIDDYGHHPTEIAATLAAARRGWCRPLVVVFQPHRYTRTRDLLGEFAEAFALADQLILTEIYPAGERPLPGISGETLYEKLRARGHPAVSFFPNPSEIPPYLLGSLKGGEMVITLGAGDVWKIGVALLEGL